ncbi:hypothetical protein AB1Y20_020186 [Prymnesium parvum]|uniref:Choline/carnitine acyltransferase domain-containing protein n=1 Tax=Prymnesium parvum TaxID=97485 RepID=A0AB34JXE7_PRYPA|mmetsp:Transcript_42401/g.102843  ORF Transcript_42401/g.102843 Transcript_42401/m.102843 type:complete len:615 (-) Transcript_42401:564-2408(-)
MVPSDSIFPSQQELPPLPLPKLSDTLSRYLLTCRPVLSDDEYAHTKVVVEEFLQAGGDGEQLQKVLEERASSERNWIEEWWEQLAYLRSRTTMAIHINWFGMMPDFGVPITNVQAAALLVFGILHVKAVLEAGKYPVEKMRGNPLDMHQFTRIFGMTRVPVEGMDTLQQQADSKHIAVLRDGAIVAVPVYTAAGQPLSLDQLKTQMAAALELASLGFLDDQQVEDNPAHSNASVLTAMNRDEWAAERATLLSDRTNAASLELVEGALFCISFDRGAPVTKEDAARMIHGGAGRDKWFDKSFNSVIFENGRGGMNAEHTPIDAMTVVSLMMNVLSFVRDGLVADQKHMLAPPDYSKRGLPPCTLLQWSLAPRTKQAIERASIGIAALAHDCEIRILQFDHFGKGVPKRAKLHPDFFMQMAIQLAFYRIHKTFCATYETGHTRAFYHGRTDTVRTLSNEAVAFVLAMEDVALTAADKLGKLKAACDAHGEQLQRVLAGQGIDRHLLGLYIAASLRGGSLPPLFTDKAYKASGGMGNFRISTSNVGYTPQFGGFAPMTPDGYGVCYAQLEKRMQISITAWRSCPETSPTLFRETLAAALCELQEVCIQATTANASKL